MVLFAVATPARGSLVTTVMRLLFLESLPALPAPPARLSAQPHRRAPDTSADRAVHRPDARSPENRQADARTPCTQAAGEAAADTAARFRFLAPSGQPAPGRALVLAARNSGR